MQETRGIEGPSDGLASNARDRERAAPVCDDTGADTKIIRTLASRTQADCGAPSTIMLNAATTVRVARISLNQPQSRCGIYIDCERIKQGANFTLIHHLSFLCKGRGEVSTKFCSNLFWQFPGIDEACVERLFGVGGKHFSQIVFCFEPLV